MADLFSIASDYVDEVAAHRPDIATQIGVPGYDHLWPDTSPEGAAATAEVVDRYRKLIAPHLDSDETWQKHGARVLDGFLMKKQSDYEEGDRHYELRHVAGLQEDVRDIFDLMDTSSNEAWGNISTRLETAAQPLSGWRATLEEGRAMGHIVSRRQAESALDQLRHLAGPDSKWLGLARDAEEDAPDVADRVSRAVDEGRRAAGEFADYVEQEYLPHAVEADGVGRERYLSAADGFLGMRIDPMETYEWGWSEVRRIQQAMTDVAAELDPSKTLAEVIAMLDTSAEYAVPSQAAFAEFIQDRQDQALRHLEGAHFVVPEEIKHVTVNLVPPGAALGAYYLQPSEDFNRPGGIWYSFGERQQIPLWGEVSTAYHEGFPGHHLQIGTAMAQQENLTRAHRLLIWYSGYGEGWALYTERLMDELGYFEKPEYRLGYYSAQQLRACRVVIDIGCHLGLELPSDSAINPGGTWDYQTAVEILHQVAAQPRDVSESEAKRYLGWPGQAISYKVGERFIVGLREETKKKQGAAFNVREFHRSLLEGGEVRLDYLTSQT
ncbi:MAG TPA: DUF885 domain-containing protein [Acidimicrobiia bacterium]